MNVGRCGALRFFVLLTATVIYLLLIPLCLAFNTGKITCWNIGTLLTIMQYEYWYVTAYMGTFFFIPFLNILIRKGILYVSAGRFIPVRDVLHGDIVHADEILMKKGSRM